MVAHDIMTENDDSSQRRRNVLKTLAATGLAGAGLAGASGSATAQSSTGRGGGGFRQLTFDVEKKGTIVEDTDAVSKIDVDEDATFDGKLTFTDLDVNEDGELVASGRLQGTLSSNPVEQISETFQNVVLGLVEDVLGILSPDSSGECPILTLDVGEIFLDLLGLQVETSTIEIDITAVAGEGNLLGNLLCAVAGLLDP